MIELSQDPPQAFRNASLTSVQRGDGKQVVALSLHRFPIVPVDSDSPPWQNPSIAHFRVAASGGDATVAQVLQEMQAASQVDENGLKRMLPSFLRAHQGKVGDRSLAGHPLAVGELRGVVKRLERAGFVVRPPPSTTLHVSLSDYADALQQTEILKEPKIEVLDLNTIWDKSSQRKENCRWIDITLPIFQDDFDLKDAIRITLHLVEKNLVQGVQSDEIRDGSYQLVEGRGFKLRVNPNDSFEGKIDSEKLYALVSASLVVTFRSGTLDRLPDASFGGKSSLDLIKGEIRGEELPVGFRCFTHSTREHITGGTLVFEVFEQLLISQLEVIADLERRVDSIWREMEDGVRLGANTDTLLANIGRATDYMQRKLRDSLSGLESLIPTTGSSQNRELFGGFESLEDIHALCGNVTKKLKDAVEQIEGVTEDIAGISDYDEKVGDRLMENRVFWLTVVATAFAPPTFGAAIACLPYLSAGAQETVFNASCYFGGALTAAFLLYHFLSSKPRV